MWEGAAEPESFPGRCDDVTPASPVQKVQNPQTEISLCSTDAIKAPLSLSPGPVGITLLCTAAFVSPVPVCTYRPKHR